MKKISYILLLVIAACTLNACGQQGVGPSKPATPDKAVEK